MYLSILNLRITDIETLSCSSQSPFAGWVVLSTPCLLGLKLPHQLYPSHYIINCFPAGFIPVICLIYLNTRYDHTSCQYSMIINIDTRIYMAMKTLRSHLNNNMKKCNLEIKGDLQTFILLDHKETTIFSIHWAKIYCMINTYRVSQKKLYLVEKRL